MRLPVWLVMYVISTAVLCDHSIVIPNQIHADFYHALFAAQFKQYQTTISTAVTINDSAYPSTYYRSLKLGESLSIPSAIFQWTQPYHPIYFYTNIKQDEILSEAVLKIHEFVLTQRSSALFNIATQLWAGKGADYQALKEFDVENAVPRFITEKHNSSEKRQQLEDLYVELCKTYTFGIDRKSLSFLSKREAHKKIMEIYESALSLVKTNAHTSASWSDVLVVPSNNSCPSKAELVQHAEKLCGNMYIFKNVRYTHDTIKDKLRYQISRECSEIGTYKQISFTCGVPKDSPVEPPKEIFHDYFKHMHMAFLKSYATVARQMLQSKGAVRGKLKNFLSDAEQAFIQWMTMSSGFDISANFRIAQYAFPYPPEIYDGPGQKLVSCTRTATEIFGSMQNIPLLERSKILFKWATQLLRNETINEIDLKEFEMNAIVSKYDSDSLFSREAFWIAKKRVEEKYIAFCKTYTIGISPEKLNFLHEPNSRTKLATLFRRVFNPETFLSNV
ncbi:hypothetical protein QR680_010401 [Steinernema hermaphroditum]|uniref:Angiotensin-converting enzyme n=1 Tax=Steinernema hermaphroditum TaxID=289476 RepID=A0AA39IQF2_9BILA|nr:hypothetical protein QR680_010401 [Steinernema hermaphroditum]